jgi:hypothetical protein
MSHPDDLALISGKSPSHSASLVENPASGLRSDDGHPCKLSRAFGPRNSMKIAQLRVIIHNGWEWRDRKDSGDAKAECKFDPERA